MFSPGDALKLAWLHHRPSLGRAIIIKPLCYYYNYHRNCTTPEPELVPIPQKFNNSRDPSNALWMCLMSTDPVSVWQYEGLDSLVPITSVVRRQPTSSHLRDIKSFLFSSSKWLNPRSHKKGVERTRPPLRFLWPQIWTPWPIAKSFGTTVPR